MSIQEALNRIRGQYAGHLRDHHANLCALLETATQGADPEAAVSEIRFRAHKISGTAATLGFTALGQTAAACEHDADQCLQAGLTSRGGAEPVLKAAGHLIARIDEAINEIG